VEPPAEFRAFASRRADDTGILAEVAARWPGAERADLLFDRLAARRGPEPSAGIEPIDPAQPRDIAAIAWSAGRRARRRRLRHASAAALAVVLLLLAFPYARSQPTRSVAQSVAQSVARAGPSSPLPLIDVVPPPWRQARLPVRTTPLPRTVDLTALRSLPAHPVRRAVALFAVHPPAVLALGEDGELRQLDRPGLLVPTSLAPDGRDAAFIDGGSVTVIALDTGTVRSYPTDERVTALLWRSPSTLLISGVSSSAILNLSTGTLTKQPYEAGAALAAEGGAGSAASLGEIVELRFAGQPATSPAQVRYWLGGRANETVVGAGGLNVNWLGAWQGPGWLIGGNAVRDAYAIDLWLPPPRGQVRFATVYVDVVTGTAGRALVRTADSGTVSAPTVLGWLDPTTVLVQAGDVDAPNLLAWHVTDGRLSLVCSIKGSTGMSVADLASWR